MSLASMFLGSPDKYVSLVSLDDECHFVGCLWAEGIFGQARPKLLASMLDERRETTDVREWIRSHKVTVYLPGMWQDCPIYVV
jgi:hypothetical protein